MTPKDKLCTAAHALDEARLSLEALAATDTGDTEIDDAVRNAVETIEAEISGLSHFLQQCA